MPGFLAAIPWLKLLTAAPPTITAAAKLVGAVKGQSRPQAKPGPQPRAQATPELTELRNDLTDLRHDQTELQDRFATLEANVGSQTEWIAQFTGHYKALLRWVLVMALALFVTGGVAIAGLVVALLR